MEGWISLHRKIKEHWLWQSDNRLKWWIDLMLTVNHEDKKVLIGGTLIDCNRGQSVRSLSHWAKDWNVTKKTVRDFFILLQKDGMIKFENIKISTRITICKYDSYQIVVNDKETQSKRKVNGEETTSKRELPTNNNDNNDNNIYNAFFDSEIYSLNKNEVFYEDYVNMVKFIFGENTTQTKLNGVLKIEKQLNYSEFSKLMAISDYEKICLKLYSIENNKKYQGYKSLYMTLINWTKRDSK